MDRDRLFPAQKSRILDDESRLGELSEQVLRSLLALSGDDDIVDLGSGVGFYTNRLAAWTTGAVYAVDVQPELQALHRDRGVPSNVRLVLADIDDLPLPPASVDRAVSINTFHEAHKAAGLRHLALALRPAGRFVIVDWRKDPLSTDIGPRLESRLSEDEVGATLAPFFSIASMVPVGRHFYAVTARPHAEGVTPLR